VGSSSSTKLMKKSGVESVPSRTEKQQGKKKRQKQEKSFAYAAARKYTTSACFLFLIFLTLGARVHRLGLREKS
jgi:hypothetical protein